MFQLWTPEGKTEAFLTHSLHLITVPLFEQLTVQLWIVWFSEGTHLRSDCVFK